MMKPAEDGERDDLCADLGDRPRCADRYSLPQTLMGPSAIEVDLDVLLQNATKVSLAEYDYVVEALPAHQTKEAFADGDQIGRARRDLDNLDVSGLGQGGERLPERLVVVSDEVLRSVAVRRVLPELLGRPSVSGAAGDVEVNESPGGVYHEEEREDGAKAHVVELQEVARPKVAAVVSDEGGPALAPFTRWPYLPQTLLNGSFTDPNAKFQQLASDAPKSTLSLAIAWMRLMGSGASRFG